MEHAVFRTTFRATTWRLWALFGGAFCAPETDQNDVRQVMPNEVPKKADLDPGGGSDRATLGSTLGPVVKRTFPQKMAILRGRDTQMAQASVYKPLKDRL